MYMIVCFYSSSAGCFDNDDGIVFLYGESLPFGTGNHFIVHCHGYSFVGKFQLPGQLMEGDSGFEVHFFVIYLYFHTCYIFIRVNTKRGEG